MSMCEQTSTSVSLTKAYSVSVRVFYLSCFATSAGLACVYVYYVCVCDDGDYCCGELWAMKLLCTQCMLSRNVRA